MICDETPQLALRSINTQTHGVQRGNRGCLFCSVREHPFVPHVAIINRLDSDVVSIHPVSCQESKKTKQNKIVPASGGRGSPLTPVRPPRERPSQEATSQ